MKIFFRLILILSLLTGTIVSAANLEEKKADFEQKAENAKRKADVIQEKIDSVSEVKRVLDEEAAVAVADYEEKQAALDETVARIKDNDQKLKSVEKDFKVKRKVLEKRVRDIYVNGQISYLDVIFGAKDFNDFLTRMDLFKRIMIQDSVLVNLVLEYRNDILSLNKQLEEDKKSQKDLAWKAEIAKELKLKKVAEQQALIDKMQKDKSVYDKQYDEMIAASKEVERLIQQSKYRAQKPVYRQRESDGGGSSYVPSGSGSMIWPLNGPITSEFGWRNHPIFGGQRFHSGLDIGGDYGLPIVAAQSGTVSHAGWISGYGNTIMIEHGGGIVTLYGHNQSLAVEVGQQVNQGDVIAYCGSTGNSTGPHCHFEVRQNGEPVSPHGFL